MDSLPGGSGGGPVLQEPQRSLALTTATWGRGDDKSEMLRMLSDRGLERKRGVPDYAYVQMLSDKIPSTFIKCDAAKDFQVPLPKGYTHTPPSAATYHHWSSSHQSSSLGHASDQRP